MSIKLYKEVALYPRENKVWNNKNYCYTGEIYYDYYVADNNDKNQHKTGNNWARRSRDEEVEPIITDNSGFHLEINMSARNSSQGGKLSFWMCKITKGDSICGNIGINQKELKDLLKDSTFVKGVCQEEVCFYRINGNIGVCVVGSEKYKLAIADRDKDEKLKKVKKTTKWELGRNYYAKTTNNVYICDGMTLGEEKKGHIILSVHGDETTIEDIVNRYDGLYYDIVEKFPSRAVGDLKFDVSNIKDLIVEKQINYLVDHVKTYVEHKYESFSTYLYRDIILFDGFYKYDIMLDVIACLAVDKLRLNRIEYNHYKARNIENLNNFIEKANINMDLVDKCYNEIKDYSDEQIIEYLENLKCSNITNLTDIENYVTPLISLD